jgi:vacuolar-type H+-ATPase subunit E/Vma4
MSPALDAAAATAALAPVRAALLDRARAEAEATVRTAQAEADRTLAEGAAQARALVDQARREGAADAEAALAAERSRTRRRCRGLVLGAQRAAYDALRTTTQEQVAALRDDTQWPAMRARLVARGRHLLGPDAELAEVPDGVVVRAGTRSADLTLSSLAEDRLEELGPEVGQLWVP